MKAKLIKLLCVIVLASCIFGCQTSNPTPQEIKQRICLIPPSDRSMKFYDKMSASMLAKFKNPTLKETAAKESFKHWKKYEDEYVSFIYPDDPSVVFEIKRPKDQIPIMGGAVDEKNKNFLREAIKKASNEDK